MDDVLRLTNVFGISFNSYIAMTSAPHASTLVHLLPWMAHPMPANLSPEYKAAEANFRKARDQASASYSVTVPFLRNRPGLPEASSN
jgi:hypothetical protein